MGGASKLLMLLSTPFPLLYRRPSALRLARHSRLSPSALSTAAGALSRLPSSGPRRFSVRATKKIHTQTGVRDDLGDLTGSLTNHRVSHPWPEWSRLVDHLMAGGYSSRRISVAAGGDDDDSFLAFEDLPGEFVKAAEACLSFARDRPDLLRLLSKKDIEVIVENGSPFLFKNGVNSTRRMGLYLSGGETDVLESERAQTVDVIRYLLSYACNPSVTSDKNNIKTTEITEASIRNLLNELVNVSGTVRESNFTESIPRLPPLRHEQLSRSPGQDIEMKRGDWICPSCSFMNFARNVKCLACKVGRPKRQLTGGEWECPQCDFFNYGRNMSCLRCDCNRPGESPPIAGATPGTSSGFSSNPSFEQILNRNNTDKTEIERRLAANDEKAERWFSKVSQLDDESDLSRAAADEDFPEIMPLRKGENRFVVSTRKTPLERRLANAQHRGNLGNDGTAEGSGSDRTRESSINQSLDRILGRSSSTPGTTGENAAAGSRFKFSEYKQSASNQRSDDYFPFVPLPADMFIKSKASDNNTQRSSDKDDSSAVKFSQPSDSSVSKISDGSTESKIDNEPSDADERWSKKVAELDNVADLSSAISDEDFPEIMPMRKGENRFVVSKKKDRSLTSPQYKRRLAMEQANNSNFVPFVPFPPDYFAKKDKQPEASPPAVQLENENSSATEQVPVVTEKLPETKPVDSKIGAAENMSRRSENWTDNNRSTDFSRKSSNGSRMGSVYGDPAANPAPASSYSWNNKDGASQPAENSQNTSWKFSGKSLEGSAVKEPDPLDMSEEAKAERWFRRVAQIKDISELSQIPDEDFPEIMPMRKGVNRFVVSKRKTPLERRLTNPQYRRNLPIVSSEPEKDASS